MPSPKAASLALLTMMAACGGTADVPVSTSIAQNQGGAGGGGSGGGGGGGTADSCGGLQFFAPLYFVDQPLARA